MYNIMIIDSDADAMAELRACLSAKFNAIGLTSGFPALEAVKKKHIDLFIVRMKMEYMDGLKTMKAIRKEPGYKDAPVFFLAPNLRKDTIEECILSGATFIIEKPYKAAAVKSTAEVAMLRPERLTFLKDYNDFVERDKAWAKLKIEHSGVGESGEGFKSFLENELSSDLVGEIMGLMKD